MTITPVVCLVLFGTALAAAPRLHATCESVYNAQIEACANTFHACQKAGGGDSCGTNYSLCESNARAKLASCEKSGGVMALPQEPQQDGAGGLTVSSAPVSTGDSTLAFGLALPLSLTF